MKINVDQFVLGPRRKDVIWHIKRQHPFSYALNRLQWYVYPKLRIAPRFPIHIDFEISSLCNMSCPMCFRPHRKNKEDGLMDIKLYKKAIDECVKYNLYSIRLSWRGESTVHPGFTEMARYAKERGIKEVSFLTNGLDITPDYADELIRIGVDYISFSIDGLHEDYESIRKPATFEGILERLRYLRKARNSLGHGYPRIKINTIWTKIKDRAHEYFEIFSPIADIISFNPDYDYSKDAVCLPTGHQCQYPYQRLTVAWNGKVPMCISDWDIENIIGDLNTQSIYEIWNGERMRQVKMENNNRNIVKYWPCRKCHRPVTEQIGNQRKLYKFDSNSRR